MQGRPLIGWTVDAVQRSRAFAEVVLVVTASRCADAARLGGVTVVGGGARRRDSVAAGMDALGECEVVCIHDGARPFCPPDLFVRVVEAAARHGAATAAVPCVDTIKRVAGGVVVETLPRDSLVAVQTPQAFRLELLREAHRASDDDASDDCVLVERLGAPVAVVDGDPRNRKITHAEDIEWLRRELAPA